MIASKRSEFEITIKKVTVNVGMDVNVEVTQAEYAAKLARDEAIRTAEAAKNAAESVFNSVVSEARIKLAKLRNESEEVRRQYEIKVQVVARARAAAELAKARALQMQT